MWRKKHPLKTLSGFRRASDTSVSKWMSHIKKTKQNKKNRKQFCFGESLLTESTGAFLLLWIPFVLFRIDTKVTPVDDLLEDTRVKVV